MNGQMQPGTARAIAAPNITRHKSSVIAAILIIATVAVYWQVRSFPFITLDDPVYVYENPSIQDGLTFKSVAWAFATDHAGFWIPATWLSYMVDFEFHGLNPGGYHLTNLLLHLANILLLFSLLARMTGSLWRSGLAAALFGLHPLHVESVVWITERKDVLSTFFGLLTIHSYVSYVKDPRFRHYLFITLSLCVSLMAKPMLVTLPFVLLLLDYWPLNRWPTGNSYEYQGFPCPKLPLHRLIREKAPLFLIIVLAAIVVYLIQSNRGVTDPLPFDYRLQNGVISYVTYLGRMAWPASLGILYPLPDHFPTWMVVGSFLLLLAISTSAFFTARKHPYFIVGWLWYLGTMAPVIGLIQVGNQANADRFTYVPLIGLYIALSWGLDRLSAKQRTHKIFVAMAMTVLLLTLLLTTHKQVGLWHSGESLYRHTLKVTSNNHQIHSLLGGILLANGNREESLFHSSEAIRLKPDSPEAGDAHYNLGLIYSQKGQPMAAIHHYRQAIALNSPNRKARNNLGIELMQTGQPEEAVRQFSLILSLNAADRQARLNMGNALVKMGRLEEGYAQLEGVSQDPAPDRELVLYNMGIIRKRQGRMIEAIILFQNALRLNPDFEAAQKELELWEQINPGGTPSPGQ